MVKRLLVLLFVVGSLGTAAADSWHSGPAGQNRKRHLLLTASVGAAYLTTFVVFGDALTPDHCRWCDPPSIDTRTRNALVWDTPSKARTVSDILGVAVIPTFAVAVPNVSLIFSDPGWAEVIDVTLPIAESVLATQILTYFAKSAFARERPYVQFAGVRPSSSTSEDFVSHWSGHTSLSFSLVTSAGMVAHMRNLRAEPYIWGVGLTLAATTGYLRMAGDMHYLTDVLVGAAVGAGAGLTIPHLFGNDIAVTTAGRSVAIVGQF